MRDENLTWKNGICGQAPSDYPEFAEWLVQEGIDSISLSPDVALRTAITVAKAESGLSLTRLQLR